MKPISEMPVGPAPFPENEGDAVSPIRSTTSTVRLDVNHDGSEHSLLIRYVLTNREPVRRELMHRMAIASLAILETRYAFLTDAEAIAELDEVKAKQDATHWKRINPD